jgi:PAS domain S-box-containing protein
MEPAEAKRVSKLLRLSAQREESFYSLELALIRRDGTPVIVEASGNPFFDGNGKLLGYRTISRDITKRKRVEEALIAAENKYRNIVENAVEGIYQTLPDGRVLDANPAMARILGYESVRELTEAIRDVGLQIYQDPGTRAEHLRTLEAQGFGRIEIQVRRKDGAAGWIFTNTRVVRDGEGKTLYYEGFAKDITERKCLEEKLRKANEDLENRVAERTEELNRRSAKLEELNITLRTILDQRDQDSKLLEKQVVVNINELVKPLLHTLRKTRSGAERESLLDIIESSLNEIISPFTSRLTGQKVRLTQTELQIAHCIRQGMRSKEIASLLNISKGTIDFHRNNIRRKLGIKDRKTSIRSHLLQSGQ